MANSMTNLGEQYALHGNGAGDGSIARLATKVKLYTSASVPDKDGTGFTEVANGNGYTTGGIALVLGDWTFSVNAGQGQIKLADKTWTATGGSILNVAGAFITNTANAVLAWWERATVTVLNTQTITADDLTIRL